MLRGVSPRFARKNFRNGARVYTELRAKVFLMPCLPHRPSHTNRVDLVVSQFGAPMSLAARLAALLDLICDIGEVRSEEQMVGSRTGRVIAAMQHVQTGRDWPKVQLPRRTMRSQWFVRPVAQLPVAMRKRAAPIPARFSPNNKLPESLAQGACLENALTSFTAKSGTPPSDLGWPSIERRAAVLATASNECGTLLGHRNLKSFGVAPPDGHTSRGLSLAHSTPTGGF